MASDDVDREIRKLNEAFYRSDPGDYFKMRLQLLLLAGGKRAELELLVRDGVEYAGVTITVNSESEELAGEVEIAKDASEYDEFLTIESQQLLHHAAETALRLFLIHSSPNVVPWIELNSMRSFSKFKKAVQTLVDQPPSDELVGHVCLGSQTRPVAHSEADWSAAIEGMRSFLSHLAAVYLDDANLYNAIKHGLGVRASAAMVIFGSQVVGNGPSVEFPESSDWVDDRRSWSMVTRWIDVGASAALIYVAAQMISSMWQIGQFRHLGTVGKGKLFFPTDLRAAALRTPDRPPGIRFSMGSNLIETR
jgi:hypothetical protein